MEVQRIQLISESEWNASIRGVTHFFSHTAAFQKAMNWKSSSSVFLTVLQNSGSNDRLLCPLLEREKNGLLDVTTPYGFAGPLLSGSALTSAPDTFFEMLKRSGYIAAYLQFPPLGVSHDLDWGHTKELGTDVFVLDIQPNEEELFEGVSKRRRSSLRAWLKASADDVQINTLPVKDAFCELYPQHVERVNAAGVYRLEQDALEYLLNAENVFSVGLRRGSSIVSVAVFGLSSGIGEFLFLAHDEDSSSDSAGLLWIGFRLLKSKGAKVVNLGGGIRGNDGVAEFKRRFGAKTLPTYCVKAVLDSHRYAIACQRVGANEKSLNGYFPAYYQTLPTMRFT